MNIKTILENIEELAMEDMTENGIHYDDYPDHQYEYEQKIIKDIIEIMED